MRDNYLKQRGILLKTDFFCKKESKKNEFYLNNIFLFVTIILVMAGCSSLPGKSEPVRESFTSAQQSFESGESLYNQGLYEGAFAHFESALFKYGTLGFQEGVVKSFLSMGQSSLAVGQYEKALLCYDWALPMAKALAQNELILDTANHYGHYYLVVGDLVKAVEWSEIGKSVVVKNSAVTAEYYRLLGTIAKKEEDYVLSLDMYSRALEIDRGLIESTQVGTDYYLSGSSYSLMGNYAQAESYLLLALDKDQFYEYLPGICADLTALGIILERQDRVEEALLYYKRAILAWKGINRGDKVLELSQTIDKIGEEPIVFP